VRSAPPEVRRWIANEVASALVALTGTPQAQPPAQPEALAACTPEEAMQLFETIRDDFAATLVFLELAREPAGHAVPPLHALSIADIMRHTRLNDARLVECFRAINQVFQQIRNDPEAALFGFDQANHVYIHEATHRSIRTLWQALTAARGPGMAAGMAAPVAASAAPPFGFTPAQLGPADDVAAHGRG
jgi:hypothetical protein